jgi:hypothetical protein
MIIHIRKYNSKPGTPPGSRAIKKASRNQKALIPKNSPNPPQTPATTRLPRDLRKEFDLGVIFHLVVYLKHSLAIKIYEIGREKLQG